MRVESACQSTGEAARPDAWHAGAKRYGLRCGRYEKAVAPADPWPIAGSRSHPLAQRTGHRRGQISARPVARQCRRYGLRNIAARQCLRPSISTLCTAARSRRAEGWATNSGIMRRCSSFSTASATCAEFTPSRACLAPVASCFRGHVAELRYFFAAVFFRTRFVAADLALSDLSALFKAPRLRQALAFALRGPGHVRLPRHAFRNAFVRCTGAVATRPCVRLCPGRRPATPGRGETLRLRRWPIVSPSVARGAPASRVRNAFTTCAELTPSDERA